MSGSRSVLESAVTSLEVNMYWLWEGRLLGASMVLVLWVLVVVVCSFELSQFQL